MTRSWLLVVAASAVSMVGGCRSREPLEDLGPLDLALASTRVRALAATDCKGVTRALDTIASSSLEGRATIGLVDDALAAGRANCPDLARAIGSSTRPTQRIARAKLAASPEAALAELGSDAAPTVPAIHFKRSELLEALDRPAEAAVQLAAGLAREESAFDRARELPLKVAALAASGQVDEAATLVAAAPIEARIGLANRLVAHAPVARLAALSAGPLEVATAAATRIEAEQGPALAIAARKRAAELDPNDADLQAAYARALAAGDRHDEAIAAWDRAAAIAPAQPEFRLAPIRTLASDRSVDNLERARKRVEALAEEARDNAEPEAFITASHAAVLAGIPERGVELLREARQKRPADGRLAFELALRLVDANDRPGAIEAFVELLVCGAHGQPWHRHEIAGKLSALAVDAETKQLITAALDRKRPCKTVDAAELATYVTPLRAGLQ